MLKYEVAPTKDEIVRQAIVSGVEEGKAIEAVQRARQEFKDGKELRGDLRSIVKNIE